MRRLVCKYCDHPVYPPDESGRDNHVDCEATMVQERWSGERELKE